MVDLSTRSDEVWQQAKRRAALIRPLADKRIGGSVGFRTLTVR
jgi:hypothetical protein